jgi:Fic family protein
MDAERLSRSPIGKLVPIVGPDPVTHEVVAGKAFLPDPLPRQEINLSNATWTTVNRATGALARLDGAARRIPNPGLLRRPALRREAQSTSALEGTYAPFADVLAAEENEDGRLMSAELREVLNFEHMAQLAFSWPEERTFSMTMLGELQETLVRGTAGERDDTGRLRECIVVIGARGAGFDEARFVPPPPGDQLRSGVEALLEWMASPPELPVVLQAALVHYQFECLHPYSDGNGRLGRLLVIVQLLRDAIIREPLLVVSPWFEQRRDRYQDELLALSQTGNWDRWVSFFVEGVEAAAVESQRKVERLVDLQQAMQERVVAAGKRGTAERLAGQLVGRPYVNRAIVANEFKVTGQAAYNAIQTLVEIGILERSGIVFRSGGNAYVAPEVVKILS